MSLPDILTYARSLASVATHTGDSSSDAPWHRRRIDLLSNANAHMPVDPDLVVMNPAQHGSLSWSCSSRHHLDGAVQHQCTAEGVSYLEGRLGQSQQSFEHLAMFPHVRSLSPLSQQPTWSSTESLSPPTESDAAPSTPPDTSFATSSSSWYGHGSSESLKAYQTHMVAYMGNTHVHDNPYVNLQEINPSQSHPEDGNLRMSRSPSFEGYLQADGGSPGIPETAEPYAARDAMAEVEEATVISVVPCHSVYPMPEGEASETESERGASQPRPKSDDCEWRPHPRSHRERKRKRSNDDEIHDIDTMTNISKRAPGGNGKRARSSRTHVRPKRSPTVTLEDPEAPEAGAGIACSTCLEEFADPGSLQKHTRARHLRPFTCVFHFAGCPSSFPSKNEWKRHVMTQHLALTYWLCTLGGCAQCTNPAPPARHGTRAGLVAGPGLPNGAIFNRKDLYTQHVRRMHEPWASGKPWRNSTGSPAGLDGELRKLQGQAERTRCQLPTKMQCPAAGCHEKFSGTTAWDERMEHVAKHLEAACEGIEDQVCFGGEGDPTFTRWAERPDVGVVRRTDEGGWELVNLLRGCVGPSNGNGKGGGGGKAPVRVSGTATTMTERAPAARATAIDTDGEVDADGEEDD